MKPYIVGAEAEDELTEALAYHARHWADHGHDLHAELLAAFEAICRQPTAYPVYRRRYRMYVMTTGVPFVIYSRDLSDVVWITAIDHTSRRPGRWTNRRPPTRD